VRGVFGNAQALLETAANSASAEPSDFAILIDPTGHVRMLDATGWNLGALLLESGAETAYRVQRCASRLRLEGASGHHTMVLERTLPPPVAPESSPPLPRNDYPRFKR
jgi:hypothetical protein